MIGSIVLKQSVRALYARSLIGSAVHGSLGEGCEGIIRRLVERSGVRSRSKTGMPGNVQRSLAPCFLSNFLSESGIRFRNYVRGIPSLLSSLQQLLQEFH